MNLPVHVSDSISLHVIIVFVHDLMLSQDEWGNTALSLACEGGHVETARLLLDHRANADYQNGVFIYVF